ncbi:hypothetical protein CEXT_688021 [Caerostris extrusa]|uniref:Uncharacterized protein n=1 Tax=Caerostris extrusa TaxID=172846 RepID=A0AAV4S5W7_CAEEX|nr:hypothetical protein CEXT_688021 [Caerostris extrusa]
MDIADGQSPPKSQVQSIMTLLSSRVSYPGTVKNLSPFHEAGCVEAEIVEMAAARTALNPQCLSRPTPGSVSLFTGALRGISLLLKWQVQYCTDDAMCYGPALLFPITVPIVGNRRCCCEERS